jgi:hypothetical protein
MSKIKAIVLAVFTIWPIVYMVLFMGMALAMMISAISGLNPPGGPGGPLSAFKIIFLLHFLTIIDVFALLVVYIRYLFKTETVPKDKKALWAVALFLGNMVSMPVFWYLYIWKQLQKGVQGRGVD